MREDEGNGLGVLVRDKGGHLLGSHVLEHVEPGRDGAGDTIENFLGFAGADSAFQGAAGEVHPARTHPLTSQQMLLELLQHLVLQLYRDPLQGSNTVGDLLDLVVGEKLHHLSGSLLP